MNDYTVHRIDALETSSAWLLPALASRIALFSARIQREPNSEKSARYFIARLVMADKAVQAVAGLRNPLSGSPYDDMVGHSIAEIVKVDDQDVCFVHQVEVDPGYSSLLDKFVLEADTWCKSMQIKSMRTEVIDTIPEAVWLRAMRRFDWKLVSRVMERSVR